MELQGVIEMGDLPDVRKLRIVTKCWVCGGDLEVDPERSYNTFPDMDGGGEFFLVVRPCKNGCAGGGSKVMTLGERCG
jgi:hypothetical protein